MQATVVSDMQVLIINGTPVVATIVRFDDNYYKVEPTVTSIYVAKGMKVELSPLTENWRIHYCVKAVLEYLE